MAYTRHVRRESASTTLSSQYRFHGQLACGTRLAEVETAAVADELHGLISESQHDAYEFHHAALADEQPVGQLDAEFEPEFASDIARGSESAIAAINEPLRHTRCASSYPPQPSYRGGYHDEHGQ